MANIIYLSINHINHLNHIILIFKKEVLALILLFELELLLDLLFMLIYFFSLIFRIIFYFCNLVSSNFLVFHFICIKTIEDHQIFVGNFLVMRLSLKVFQRLHEVLQTFCQKFLVF